jgi:hypothetical protein
MGTAFRSDRCIYWHRMVPVVVLLYNGHAWGGVSGPYVCMPQHVPCMGHMALN